MRRIYCVGQNYAAHVREMGGDERKPPFFRRYWIRQFEMMSRITYEYADEIFTRAQAPGLAEATWTG